jgi:HlyD family secretion protein
MAAIRKRSKILWLVGLVVAGLLAAWGTSCVFRESPDALSWDKVTRGDVRETISASGEIQSKTSINIGTSVMGEIKVLHVQDGQDVKAGDLLVTIDHERMKQQMSQASAMVDAARKDAARLEAAMKRAQESSARMESLFKQGLVADEDYRQAKLARESAELNYAAAKANVAQNQANEAAMKDGLDKTVIRAPISGRVTSLKAERGETAIPGTSNLPGATLMVISDMKEIIAEIKVNESEVVRLKLGQPAQVAVESFPNKVFQGKVYEIASAAESSGQDANMYKVKVALDMNTAEIDQLRPGMTCRAVILTAEAKNVLRVPLQSVLDREGTMEDARKKGLLSPEALSVVMIVKGHKADERSIRVGIADTEFYEVKEGVSEGEQVLTGPIRKLKELENNDSVKLKKKSDTQLEQEAQEKKNRKP